MYSEYYRFTTLAVILFFVVNTYSVFQENESNLFEKFLFPISGTLISIGVYYWSKWFIKRNPPIVFNKKAIYVDKIPILFKDVISLKTNSSHINDRHKLQISYLNKNGEENSFSFYPRILHVNLREFTILIAKSNPKAKVQKQFIGPFKFDKFSE